MNNNKNSGRFTFGNAQLRYTAKQAMIVNQATPNNHPGGFQGAFISAAYHSDCGPLFIRALPRLKAPKLSTININVRFKCIT